MTAGISIVPVGTEVELQPDIFGTVLSVTITNANPIYEIGWWNSRSYTKEHFYANQFTAKDNKKTQIGFLRN